MTSYQSKPITPITITVCFLACLLGVGLLYTWMLWYDVHTSEQKWLLEMAKTGARPPITVTHSDYMYVVGEETVVSGVTE